MIKAVLFDIDGVLLDSFAANLQFFQDLLTKAGYEPPSAEDYKPLFHLTMKDAIQTMTKASTQEVDRVWHMGKNREVQYRIDLLQMPTDAPATIKELHKTYKLGIVTSRVTTTVYEAQAMLELQKLFEVTVTYENTELHKPHPEPILHALKLLGIKPHEAVYIGDVHNDVAAARAAGTKVITYGKHIIQGSDAHAHTFSEISTIIAKL